MHVSMQSWTQNGNRTYWAVEVTSEELDHVSVGMTTQSPRRQKWLKAIHEEERRRAEQNKKGHNISDTGMYDEALVGNWMRRTDWMAIFSGVNRKLLVRLTETPAANGLALVPGRLVGRLAGWLAAPSAALPAKPPGAGPLRCLSFFLLKDTLCGDAQAPAAGAAPATMRARRGGAGRRRIVSPIAVRRPSGPIAPRSARM